MAMPNTPMKQVHNLLHSYITHTSPSLSIPAFQITIYSKRSQTNEILPINSSVFGNRYLSISIRLKTLILNSKYSPPPIPSMLDILTRIHLHEPQPSNAFV